MSLITVGTYKGFVVGDCFAIALFFFVSFSIASKALWMCVSCYTLMIMRLT